MRGLRIGILAASVSTLIFTKAGNRQERANFVVEAEAPRFRMSRSIADEKAFTSHTVAASTRDMGVANLWSNAVAGSIIAKIYGIWSAPILRSLNVNETRCL